MPWHKKPMKDAGAGDTPRGAGKQALIRGCPNGETYLDKLEMPLYVVYRVREPCEVKHLSSMRKRKQSTTNSLIALISRIRVICVIGVLVVIFPE